MEGIINKTNKQKWKNGANEWVDGGVDYWSENVKGRMSN